MNIPKSNVSTLAGIIAIIIWSSNVAVSKTVMNDLGAFNAAFYIYFFSGILNFFILLTFLGRYKIVNHFKELPFKYYYQTGIFVIFNNVFFYVALGLAKSNEELIIVALINYLWPVLITIFKVPIHHAKIIPFLFFSGIIAAFAGIVIALLQGYSASELIDIAGALDDNVLAFIFAFLGAVSWAVYSNLIRKYNSTEDIVALPVIFVISGLVFIGILFFRGEIQSLSLEPLYTNPYLVYTIIGPTCLSYMFWYFAMKYGNRNLVSSISYLIPLGSVFLVGLIHAIPVRPMFWVSAGLLVMGAVLGMKSVKD